MAKFTCISKCYYGRRVWSPGETLEADTCPSKHFVPKEKYKKVEAPKPSEPTTFVEMAKADALATLNSLDRKNSTSVKKIEEDDLFN